MTGKLKPGEDLAGSFRRIAEDEIDKVCAGLITDGGDRGAAVHEARRSFKKLRAVVRLARPSLGSAYNEENARWRDAGRVLSESRDAAVLAQSFDAIAARCEHDRPEDALANLRTAVAGRADHPPDDGDLGPQVSDVVTRLNAARPQMRKLAWPRNRKDLFRGLSESQRRLRQSWRAATREPTSETLHEWRKRVKDVSAQLTLFRAVLSDDLQARRNDARRLAELLGEEHDLCLLAEKLRRAPARKGGQELRERMLAAAEKRRDELRRKAISIGGELSATSPKGFAEAVIACWKDAASPGRKQPETTGAASALIARSRRQQPRP